VAVAFDLAGGRPLSLLVVAAMGVMMWLAGCKKPTGSSRPSAISERCSAESKRDALDNACVIEITQSEIARRFGGKHYTNYSVRFDKEANHWLVMAYDEDGPPDSHTFVLITPGGIVEQVR